MTIDKMTATDMVQASTKYNTMPEDSMSIQGFYTAVCHGADGQIKWTEPFANLVTTVGKNATLDTILGNVAAGAVNMGLKGVGTAAVTDTMASHPTWSETTVISARGTPSFSAASAGSKATSSAVSFSITGTATVAGCFIVIGGTTTVGNTTGTLFSAGDFSSSKAVVSGDTIAVTYTATLT
jgi:hypothetical protein